MEHDNDGMASGKRAQPAQCNAPGKGLPLLHAAVSLVQPVCGRRAGSLVLVRKLLIWMESMPERLRIASMMRRSSRR